MANNFRLTGNYYISKGGHDSNDGLTPDTAKKSIIMQSDTYNVFVVGAGHYSELIMSSNETMTADGLVVVDYNGSTELKTIYLKNTGKIIGFILKNANNLLLRFDGSASAIQNCVIQDCGLAFNSKQYVAKSTIFINVSNVQLGVGLADYCIFLNTTTANMTSITNTYCDIATIVHCVNTNPNSFFNNNIQGLIFIDSIFYAIQDQFTGTPQDNGYAVGVEWLTEANLTANGYTGTIVGWDAAVSTSINRDPKFNDASKGVFTLKADSPHLGRASDGISNIGGTDYEDLELVGNLSSSVLLVEISEAIDNTTNTNDWVLKAGYEEGYVRIIKKITDSDYKTLANIPYYGNYSFDSDEIGGTSGNFNVPDSKPQTNQYPTYTATTSDALDVNSIIIAGHGRIAGEWIRVQGQDREISSVDTNTIYFLDAVRAIVLSGTEVKIGSESELAALLPNRLNFELRTSKVALVDASNWNTAATWDNDNLAAAGNYLAQELNNTPMIDNLNGVGFGDDLYDSTFGNKIRAKYVDLKIWIRDNYKS